MDDFRIASLYGATLAVVTAAAAIVAEELNVQWVTIQNDHDSPGHLLIGSTAEQTIRLGPGQSQTFDIRDPSNVFVRRFDPALAATARIQWGI